MEVIISASGCISSYIMLGPQQQWKYTDIVGPNGLQTRRYDICRSTTARECREQNRDLFQAFIEHLNIFNV